jgi:epoxide hydrolase-like protein
MRAIEPFTIDVDEATLDDLRRRLRFTRWPEPATAGGWAHGVPLDYLRDLCTYWADGYGWRATESRLKRLAPVPDRDRRQTVPTTGGPLNGGTDACARSRRLCREADGCAAEPSSAAGAGAGPVSQRSARPAT